MPKQKPNEQVQQIPLSEIRPFKNHPFKVTDDELMQQTIDSIMQVGVLNPAIIRPAPEGGYEMVAGHRRLHAADLAGLKTIPAIVRNLDDDEAGNHQPHGAGAGVQNEAGSVETSGKTGGFNL